jgi:flagellar biosynthesis GTPase FlhF
MPAALEAMEKELGSEALVISVRRYPPRRGWKTRRKSGVEVTAIPSAAAVIHPSACQIGTADPVGTNPVSWKEGEEKNLIHTAKQAPVDNPARHPTAPLKAGARSAKEPAVMDAALPASLSGLRERLMAQGVDALVVAAVVQSALENLGPQELMDERTVVRFAGRQLQMRLPTNDGGNPIHQKIVCIIGANGSGKTSLGAQVAAHAARSLGRKVRWITADTLRAGAIAKAQAITVPLGIPLNLAYSPEELSALVGNRVADELIVVDTPGCNPYRAEEIKELGGLLAALPERYTLLAAPAIGKEEDFQNAAAALHPLGVDGLAVSKMDETHTFGGLYNFACRTRLPIALYTVGPRIICDLRPADPSILVDALLGRA